MEGREERLLSGSRPPRTVLLNSTTPTQGISEVRDPKSHESLKEILWDCSLYIYNLSSSKIIPVLSLKAKRGQDPVFTKH